MKGSLPSKIVYTCGLAAVLCGCTAVPVADQYVPKAAEAREPNTARIYAHVGNIVPYYWVDWGTGARRNALIRRVDVGAVPPGVKLTSEALEGLLLQPVQRPPQDKSLEFAENSPLVVCLDSPGGRQFGYPSNPDVVTIPIKDSSGKLTDSNVWDPKVLLSRAEMPLDACFIGRLGRGGTLVWDRPPGRLDIDVFTPSIIVGRHGGAFMHIPLTSDVEAGKTYHIYWKWGFKFEIKEEGATK